MLPARIDLYDAVVPLMPEGWLDGLAESDVWTGWEGRAAWLQPLLPALEGLASVFAGRAMRSEGGPASCWLHVCTTEGGCLGWHPDRPDPGKVTAVLSVGPTLSSGCGGELVVRTPRGELQYATAQGDVVFFDSSWLHRSNPLKVDALRVKATAVFEVASG